VAVTALVLATLVACSSPDPNRGSPSGSPQTGEGLCGNLAVGVLTRALGKQAVVTRYDEDRCTITREGGSVSVDLVRTPETSTRKELDELKRSSGAEGTTPVTWKRSSVTRLGVPAYWFAEPGTKGNAGELYLLVDRHQIRLSILTAEGFSRSAREVAERVAPTIIRSAG
jgi:hypothetical protein